MLLPSIDQNICGQWTEQQIDLYNKLPFYLLEAQAQYRKHWTVWAKLLDSVAWKPNQGDTMRRVAAEPTPIIRQEAYPVRLNTTPLVDVINYRERKLDSFIHWQDFVSPNFYFLPEFQDFMKHIDRTMQNLNMQITVFEDVFYRTRLFHHAPYVYVAGVGLIPAPVGDGDSLGAAGTSGKTWAWLDSVLALLAGTQQGYLTFEELFKAMNAAEQDAGMTPFEGTGKPNGDSNPLNERFCIVQSAESWNNFVNDPWLKENRPLAMNIVTESFKGDLWGRIRSKLERFPLRYSVDNNYQITALPNPQIIEEDPNREDLGRTKPNPAYSLPSNSQVEVAFLMGGSAAEYIETGPPPSEFTRNLDQGAVTKMNWNGKAYLTKDFLVPCRDTAGNVQKDINSWGRYIRAQGTLAVGISPMNAHNVLPIIYKRRIGVSTVSQS